MKTVTTVVSILALSASSLLFGYSFGVEKERDRQRKQFSSQQVIQSYSLDTPQVVTLPTGQEFVGIITPDQVGAMGYPKQTWYVTRDPSEGGKPKTFTVFGHGHSPETLEKKIVIKEQQ